MSGGGGGVGTAIILKVSFLTSEQLAQLTATTFLTCLEYAS